MLVSAALVVLATAVTVRLAVRLARRAAWGGRLGASRPLRRLFRAIDTTPGQERVIRQSLEEAWNEARAARDEVRAQRGRLAAALREGGGSPALTEVRVASRAAYDRAEAGLLGALGRIHEVLDPLQRERLAQLLEGARSPWLGPLARVGGPYRGPVSL